MAWTYPVS